MTSLHKPDLLAAMAAHLRATGLAEASLRPLARAAGTSDRMLIYHFGTKAGLIAALLDRLSQEYLGALDAALASTQAASEAALAQELLALLRSPTFRPYLKIWFDILSATGRDEPDHSATARQMLTAQVAVIAARMPDHIPNPETRAKAMLGAVQGALVLDLAGMSKAANLALAHAYPKG